MAKSKKKADPVARLYQSLLDVDHKAKARGEAIPAMVVKQESWQGLAFTLDGVKVISATDEIRELLHYPDSVTPIPGSKDWMLGLANVRGELLPIIDLQRFIGGATAILSDRSRVLVIRNQGMSIGLLVDSVQGMRHLPVDQRVPDAQFEGAVGRYVYDMFAVKDEVWPVFSMAGLVSDSQFMNAAL